MPHRLPHRLPHALARAAVLALTCAAAAAQAHTVEAGFTFTLSGNANVPTMTLVNSSDADFRITGFSLSAGRTDRGWDYVQELIAPAGGSATLVSPDALNGSARSYTIDIDFSGFGAGTQSSWVADLDSATANLTTDYRNSLFNNGTAPNAALQVRFESLVPGLDQAPFTLGFALPDGATNASSYSFSGAQSFAIAVPPPPIPEPGTALLGAGGLAALWLALRRRPRRG